MAEITKVTKEKVVDISALKRNHDALKNARKEKRAARKAEREAAGKKPVGEKLKVVGSYVSVAAAAASIAVATMKVLDGRVPATTDPIEQPVSAVPETPAIEVPAGETVVPTDLPQV